MFKSTSSASSRLIHVKQPNSNSSQTLIKHHLYHRQSSFPSQCPVQHSNGIQQEELKNKNTILSPSIIPFDSIPGPKGFPIIGNLIDMAKHYNNTQYYFLELVKKYGPITKLKIVNQKMILLCNVEMFKDLVRRDEGRICAEPIRSISNEMGVIPSPIEMRADENWQDMRSLFNIGLRPDFLETVTIPQLTELNGTFTRSILQSIVPNMEDKTLGDWKMVNVKQLVGHYTFQSVGKMFLGVNLTDEILKTMPVDEFIMHSENTIHLNQKMMNNFPLYKFIETKDYKQLRRSTIFVADFTKKLVTKFSENSNPGKPRLKELIEERAMDIPRGNEMVNQVISGSFVAASDVTTNNAITLLYRIAHEKEYQEKLFQEIKQHLGEPSAEELKSENGLEISAEQFKSLKLCKNFVDESLRMNNIAFTPSARQLSKDIMLCDKYELEKGTIILPFESPETSHPYMEKSCEFIPERFDKSSPYAPKTTNCSNPFGLGLRRCPGSRSALAELTLILINIVRHFKLSHSNGSSFPKMETSDIFFNIDTKQHQLYLTFRDHLKNLQQNEKKSN